MKTYAQHLEDIRLDYLTGNKEKGFYIDVGANDPTIDSVTKLFYERGWRGINIEPLPKYVIRYPHERPEDSNLPVAIGDKPGELKLYEQEYLTGGLTTALPEYADKSWKEIIVPVFTLTQICDAYLKEGQIIDFLKIDVEGYEFQVIKGMDWNRYRPRALCIEFTKPNTTIDVSEQWEYILIENNYRLITIDVSNKFYIDNLRT